MASILSTKKVKEVDNEKSDGEQPMITKGDRSAFLSFLKTLATFRGDLSALSAPAFLLSTVSLVEFPSYWVEYPSHFTSIAHGPDPLSRARLALTWFLASLNRQHGSRIGPDGKAPRSGKPLNPFLGECFVGKWDAISDGDGVTRVVVEQVSHHPPVTAWYIWNDEHGIKLEGYSGQLGSFSRGSVRIRRYGHAVLHLAAHNGEKHVMTLPSFNIPLTDILRGTAPHAALDSGASHIVTSTGYAATLKPGTTSEKKGGGSWWPLKSGAPRDAFTASLHPIGKPQEAAYSAEGEWTRGFEVRKGQSGGDEAVVETLDLTPAKLPPRLVSVAPLEEQDPLESRRAWRGVTEALERGDGIAAGRAKNKLEEDQRALRITEKKEGREWKRKFFRKVEGDDAVEALLGLVGESMLPDRERGGIWRVDEEAVKAFVK